MTDPEARTPDQLANEAKEQGNVHYKQAQYAKAIDFYTKAIELAPMEASYFNNRSAAYLMIQKTQSALDDALTATKLDGAQAKYFLRACKCFIQRGEESEARRYLGLAQQLDPNINATAETASLSEISKCYENAVQAMNNGQYRLAISMLDRCLQQAPASKTFLLKKAESYMGLNEYAEASSVAVSVLQSEQTNPGAWHIRGQCAYLDGDADKAKEYFQHALKCDPDHSQSRLALKKAREISNLKEQGNDAFKNGKNQEAYDFYTLAIAVDPGNGKINSKLLYNRALVLSKLNKAKEAIADCNSALEADSGYQKALLKRARLYLETSQYEEAVRDFDAAQKLDPGNRELQQELRNAKLELKKSQRKDYYKIIDVPKDADDETIRKAYKKNALKWHPDRIATGTEEEKDTYDKNFKELGEAYAVLSDPQKKARYDSGVDIEDDGHGHGHGGMNVDINDLFGMFGGGGFRASRGAGGFPFAGFAGDDDDGPGFHSGFAGGFPGGFRFG
jgi:DnaJ family protein C protein 7